jgi:hypothetical protein
MRATEDLSILPTGSLPLIALQIGNMGWNLDEVIAILGAIKKDTLQTLWLGNFFVGSNGDVSFSTPPVDIDFSRLSTALEPFKESLTQLSVWGVKACLAADLYAPLGDMRGFSALKEIHMDVAVFSSQSHIEMWQNFLPSGIQVIKIGAIGPRHHLHLARGAGQLRAIIWNRAILLSLQTLSLGYVEELWDSASEDGDGGPTGFVEEDGTPVVYDPFRDEVREVFGEIGVGLSVFESPGELSELFGSFGAEGFLPGR